MNRCEYTGLRLLGGRFVANAESLNSSRMGAILSSGRHRGSFLAENEIG